MQLLRIGFGKSSIAVRAPLHGSAATVAIAEINVVAHADLVAVINDWRARHGEEKRVEQLDFAPVIRQQRCETAANTQINARVWIVRVHVPHVIALFVRYYFERELVVVSEKHCPLATVWNRRGLIENVDDRKPVLHLES